MGIRLQKPWRPLSAAEVARLPGQLGVFQIADADGRVQRIGYAGGRSLFGLRGVLHEALAEGGEGWQFRCEVTTAYLTRYQELLMLHIADHGSAPAENAGRLPPGLGRLSPAGR